ncbi:MAG: hypothetical protein PHI63_01115 [Patescibacteria group bacterium]|nr:hypothetical protein [Patescibacteria group bacterium]
MKNYSRKVNRKLTRFNCPSTFIVRRAENSKRTPFNAPPAHGQRSQRFRGKRKTGRF